MVTDRSSCFDDHEVWLAGIEFLMCGVGSKMRLMSEYEKQHLRK